MDPNPPQILFESEVPYRVVQKTPHIVLLRACDANFELKAPPVLGINDETIIFSPPLEMPYKKSLDFGDEIRVSLFLPNSPVTDSMSTNPVLFSNGILQNHGIASLAKKASSLARCFEISYITRVDKSCTHFPRVWATDIKNICQKLIPNKFVSLIPSSEMKIGSLVRFDYIIFPVGTYFMKNLAIVPAAAIYYTPDNAISNATEKYFTMNLSFVDKIPQNEFTQYLLSGIAFYSIIYKKDLTEAIYRNKLKWNFKTPRKAEVTYEHKAACKTGDQFQNFKSTLFHAGKHAIFKRCQQDSNDSVSFENVPVFIKIKKAKFTGSETIINFIVDEIYLMNKWNLKTLEDLSDAFYNIEPTELLGHLRAFNAKLDDKEYIFNRMFDSSKKQRILNSILPDHFGFVPPVSQLPQIEDKYDYYFDRSEFGDLTNTQKDAIQAILNGTEVVVIDGAAQTGKTTTLLKIIPKILENIILPKNQSSNCLALVSSSPTLNNLIKEIKKFNGHFLFGTNEIRFLDLTSLHGNFDGSFLDILEKMLYDNGGRYELDEDEKEKLNKAKQSLNAKLSPLFHGNIFGPPLAEHYEMNPINYPASENNNNNDNDDEDDDEDASSVDDPKISRKKDELLFVSQELVNLQKALLIIFKYYIPNFIVGFNDTLISLLLPLGNYLTHLIIDEAGNSMMYDILAMVTETKNLQQLVLFGDSVGYPSDPRIKLNELPMCFNNSMKAVNLNFENVKYFQFNETFNINSGIIETIQNLFYPTRNIIPLIPKSSLETCLLKSSNIPLMFFDQDGESLHVHPTTQNNKSHTWRLIEIISKIRAERIFMKITILCYYKGQKDDIISELRSRKLNRNVEVSSVDAYSGRNTDVAIVVTTKTLDKDSYPRKYERISRDGQWYFQRLPMDSIELGEDINYFHFVMDKQRLLTAISRASKATFIIGSEELLENNVYWKSLISTIKANQNYITEPLVPQYLRVLQSSDPRKRRWNGSGGGSSSNTWFKRSRNF